MPPEPSGGPGPSAACRTESAASSGASHAAFTRFLNATAGRRDDKQRAGEPVPGEQTGTAVRGSGQAGRVTGYAAISTFGPCASTGASARRYRDAGSAAAVQRCH
jgi:hypothetical protein